MLRTQKPCFSLFRCKNFPNILKIEKKSTLGSLGPFQSIMFILSTYNIFLFKKKKNHMCFKITQKISHIIKALYLKPDQSYAKFCMLDIFHTIYEFIVHSLKSYKLVDIYTDYFGSYDLQKMITQNAQKFRLFRQLTYLDHVSANL